MLHRVDERTERMDDRLDTAIERTESNQEDIDALEDQVQRNTTIIGGITGGVGMIVMWAADKISRFT